MGVEAARLALRSAPGAVPSAIWFATATPPYLDKTNAATIHAALRQATGVAAFDFGGALRSGTGALSAALSGAGTGSVLVVGADLRDGQPTSSDEAAGGDGAAAVLVADDSEEAPVIAEYLGGASVTDEFLDRWRSPGERRSRTWEERFGETRYLPLAAEAWEAGLKAAGVVGRRGRAGSRHRHARARRPVRRRTPGHQGRRPRRRPRLGGRPVRHGPSAARPGLDARGGRSRRGRRCPGTGRRGGRPLLPHDVGPRRLVGAGPPQPAAGRGRGASLRKVPRLAGHGRPRAAETPRTRAGVLRRRLAQ